MRMQVTSGLREVEGSSQATEEVGMAPASSFASGLPVPPSPDVDLEMEGWMAYLRSLNLLDGEPKNIELRKNGESSRIIAIDDLVIKRACRLLDTGNDWLANPYRTAAEGKALRRVGNRYPALVPKVHHMDEANAVLVLSKTSGTTFKAKIFAGVLNPDSMAALVTALQAVHSLPAEKLDGLERFMTLRLAPYYLQTAAAKPEYATAIHEVVDRLHATRTHFVHGDFCPKNVLVDDDSPKRVTLLDWDVAHLGDPAFDYAFFITHLVAKLHVKEELEDTLSGALSMLLGSYMHSLGGDHDWLTQLTGATILARCWGASRLEYLDEGTRLAVSDFGASLLNGSASLGELL